jgi:hypothetical protein
MMFVPEYVIITDADYGRTATAVELLGNLGLSSGP